MVQKIALNYIIWTHDRRFLGSKQGGSIHPKSDQTWTQGLDAFYWILTSYILSPLTEKFQTIVYFLYIIYGFG